MSTPTLTNIPINLDIRVKEPSGIGAQVPPSGPGSPDRFSTILSMLLRTQKGNLILKKIFLSILLTNRTYLIYDGYLKSINHPIDIF